MITSAVHGGKQKIRLECCCTYNPHANSHGPPQGNEGDGGRTGQSARFSRIQAYVWTYGVQMLLVAFCCRPGSASRSEFPHPAHPRDILALGIIGGDPEHDEGVPEVPGGGRGDRGGEQGDHSTSRRVSNGHPEARAGSVGPRIGRLGVAQPLVVAGE